MNDCLHLEHSLLPQHLVWFHSQNYCDDISHCSVRQMTRLWKKGVRRWLMAFSPCALTHPKKTIQSFRVAWNFRFLFAFKIFSDQFSTAINKLISSNYCWNKLIQLFKPSVFTAGCGCFAKRNRLCLIRKVVWHKFSLRAFPSLHATALISSSLLKESNKMYNNFRFPPH